MTTYRVTDRSNCTHGYGTPDARYEEIGEYVAPDAETACRMALDEMGEIDCGPTLDDLHAEGVEPDSLTIRMMAYDGYGAEMGMLTLAEAREQYEDVVYDADSHTITVGDEIEAEDEACEHPGMERGACIECGERCTHSAIDDMGICQDHECPIHGWES